MSRRGERGQGLVEFAVVLPIIIVLVFGILDLGRAVFTYNTLAQAARQAARTAIVNQDETAVRNAAFAYAPSIDLTAGDVQVCFKDHDSSERDCASAADDCPSAGRVVGCLAIVEARLDYVPMTPVIGSLIGTVQLSSVSVLQIEYVCPNADRATCS